MLFTAFLAASLISYDPADGASGLVYPPHPRPENWCGPAGAYLAACVIHRTGLASYLLVLAGLSLAWDLFRRHPRREAGWRLAGFVLVFLAALGFGPMIEYSGRFASAAGPAGTFGLVLSNALDFHLSRVGSILVLLPCLLGGVLLALNGRLHPLVALAAAGRGIAKGLSALWHRRRTAAPTASTNADLDLLTPADEDDEEDAAPEEDRLRIVRTGFDPADVAPIEIMAEPDGQVSDYRLPDLDILDDPEPFEIEDHEQTIREQARQLEKTLAEFDMKVKVVQIDTGPVVTQYEIELEPGLRARKVMASADDLAIALRAPSVRIVAPIPGKNTVGIEVPNEKRAKVGLKEVMLKSAGVAAKMRLPLYLGKDVKGLPLVFDLANMPHLLIAGRTGTGKSVCLNALILSIAMTRTPEQVKMLMIDPKMVELSLYKDIPHLLHPVVTDMKKAEALLAWAVDKMEERYDLLARVGVRHIDAYNRLGRDEVLAKLGPLGDEEKSRVPAQMPYLLIFADEMADLIMTAAKEVEGHIIRLAQKSRAVGIHLVLATQKPTVDVITGLIKSNLPARIAFQVASRTDSRVVLDEMGAEKLLGNGDMLFLYPGTSKIMRAQGTFVSDQEVGRVTEHLAAQGKPQFSAELAQVASSAGAASKPSGTSLADRDELYEQAIDVIVHEQRGSVSLLQRALGIGYGRGARLIDFMAEDGIVGAYNGSQAREVLLTPEEWNDFRRSRFGKAG